MQRRHRQIFSPAIGQDMDILAFGHLGAPVIAFPTWDTAYDEYETQSMVNALASLIDDGRIKLYCVGTIDGESWLNQGMDPHWRAIRHNAYQEFVVNNLVPFIRQDCNDEQIRIALTGCDFGAYHAVNFALKFPNIFHYALGMSGLYDLDDMFDEKSDSLEVYYNNPMAYLPNLADKDLDYVRDNTHLTLVCGRGNWDERSLRETERLAASLKEKEISHEQDVWGHDVTPDWYWWHKQIRHHLGKTFT